MYLLKSWKESFLLLLPRNFKLFLLVTLKTIGRLYYIWFKHFWWLFVIYIMLEKYLWIMLLGGINKNVNSFVTAGQFFIFLLIFFTMILSARSSVKKKCYPYFWDYKKHFVIWLYGALFFLLLLGAIFAGSFIGSLFKMELYSQIISDVDASKYAVSFFSVFLSSLFLGIAIASFFTLFFLDTRGNFKDMFLSLYRAYKMAKLNYPFCLIINFVLLLFSALFTIIISVIIAKLFDPILLLYGIPFKYTYMLFWPIQISFFTNFYIKRLHDQFSIYFGE